MKSIKHFAVVQAVLFLALWLCQNAAAVPNFAPFTPNGWSTPVVVTTSDSSTVNSSGLTSADSLFVDWCVINNGSSSAAPSAVSLYVDGVEFDSWSLGALPVNNYTFVTAEPIGFLPAGSHTISITADPGHVVLESNESDNSYTNTVNIADAFLPAPALSAPANGVTNLTTAPAFSWSSVAGASSYRFFIAAAILDLPVDPSATNGGLSVATNAVLATTSFTPSTALLPGTTYYWEVQGNSASQFGHWSTVGSFTTAFPTAPGLTIVPTFDTSITSDPQAATIEATILSSIAAYRHYFSDNVTVAITYKEMSGGLGENSFSYDTISYSEYLAALQSHATSADDATALANLPNTPENPVNGNTSINIKFPLARALGLDASSGTRGGTIFLHTSIMNLSGGQTNPTKYSLYSTVCHETDEVLGLGSALDLAKDNGGPLSDPIFSQDLFRYDENGDRSYTTNVNATSYFSLDGSDLLARFNQVLDGDLGDWYSLNGDVIPEVQDAFLLPGVFPMLGVELRALDAIGYTPAIVSAKSDQTISFAPLPNRTLGQPPFTLSATASSGLPVTFSVLSGPASISGNTVTVAGLGTVVIQAAQSGNASFNPAANVDESFTVFAEPTVDVSLSGANMVLSWPTNVAGYVLESATNLTPPIKWQVIAATPSVISGLETVTIAATNQVEFFRLAQ